MRFEVENQNRLHYFFNIFCNSGNRAFLLLCSLGLVLLFFKELAASSDSDLLKSAPPPWTAAYLKPKFRLSPEKDQSISDSSHTTSSQEAEDTAQAQGMSAHFLIKMQIFLNFVY